MLLFVVFSFCMGLINANPPTSRSSEYAEDVKFLITNRNEIFLVDGKNSSQERFKLNATAIGDIDYHLSKNLLFWIDAEKLDIHSQPLDVYEPYPYVTFKQKTAWQPVSLAVDFVSDKVYVADYLGMKIDVFELDGKFHSVVMGSNLINPLDIKLDPYESYLFILDGFRIVRSNTDGSSPIVIIPQGIRLLHGFSIDLLNKDVYWSRDRDFQMMKSNYSGENVTSLEKDKSSQFIYTKFTVFNGSIYWSSDFVKFVSRCCDEQKGMRRKTIFESNPVPTIKTIHSLLQKPASNPCENNNGGCKHMCILSTSNSHRCACNTGWKLADNSKDCVIGGDFMIYTIRSIMKSHFISNCSSAFCEPYLPINEYKSLFPDFDYLSSDNHLYYIVKNPTKNDVIYRIQPNVSQPEIFLSGLENSNYQSLSIDSIRKNVYVVNSWNKSIDIININNKSQKSILMNLTKPGDIIVHSNASYIFFLQSNRTTGKSVFNRARLDGSNLITFDYMQLKEPCGFAVDFEDNRIYWYEWQNKSIHHSNLNFNDVESIQSTLTKYLYAINVHKEWVYVVTTTSEGIWRFNKKTGENSELISEDFFNRITKVKVFSAITYIIDDSTDPIDDKSSGNNSKISRSNLQIMVIFCILSMILL